MKVRLLIFLVFCFSLNANSQITYSITAQNTQCFGDSTGSITVDSIMGCFAPITIQANGTAVTVDHLVHEGISNVLHADGIDTTTVLSMWAGNNGLTDVYVIAGFMDDTLTIGGTSIAPTSAGTLAGRDGFIACIDQNTNVVLWSAVLGDSASGNFTQFSSISSDGQSLYAAGLVNNAAFLNGYQISGSGFRSALAKIDLLTGVVDTVVTFSNTGFGFNYATGVDVVNNKVYVTGGFGFGGINLAGSTLTASGGEDIYVVALDPSLGTQFWANLATGASNQYARKIKANSISDTTTRIYITGRIDGASSFGTSSVTTAGSFDVIIAALDSTGSWLWANGIGSTSGNDEAFGLEVSTAGDKVFVGGQYGGAVTLSGNTFSPQGVSDGFVLGMDNAGALTNFYSFGGAGADLGVTSLDYVDGDYLVFGALFQGSITYADSLFATMGTGDAFIGKIGLDSNEVYGVQFMESSNNGEASFVDVAVNNGRVLGAGYFLDDASAIQPGLLANGNRDGMVTNMSIMALADTVISFTNLAANSYPVIITDNNGNTAIDSAAVGSPAQIVLSAIIGGASSAAASDGFIDLSVNGGTPGYTYSWSNGELTQDIDTLTFGTYIVAVFDTNGCSATDTFYVDSIFVAIPMISSGIITNNICFGDTNGAINLSVQYGSAPYSFLWNTADTTEDLINISQGIYTVTITDSAGAVLIDTFVVAGNPEIVLSTSVTATSTSASADGEIDLSVSGGTAPYSYQWSNFSTTEDQTGLLVGTYGVTVTDTLGCTAQLIVNVDSLGAAGGPFVVTFSVTNELCFGDSNGEVNVTVSGGTPPYSYTWSSGQITQDLSNIGSGLYFFTVIDSDTSSYSDSVTVLGNPEIVLSGVVTPPTSGTSNDGAVNIIVSGGTPGYSFLWSNAQTTEDISGLDIGSYTVIVTDSAGCATSATFAVDTIPALNLVSIATDVTCIGTDNGTVDLTIIGGLPPYTILWSNGEITEDISGLSAGAYNVTVTDSFGQVEVLTDSVGSNPVFPSPIVGPIVGSASVQSWNLYTYQVPLSNGSAFTWSATGGSIDTSSSNLASVLWNAGPNGMLYVTETDVNGCLGSDSLAVTIIFLGVNESHENVINVYPNPSSGDITIDLPEAFNKAILSVRSMNGQLVVQKSIEGLNNFISLEGVSKGTYIMNFEADGSVLQHKVVIQ